MNRKITATGITIAAALAISLVGTPSPATALPTGPTPQAAKLKQTKHADVDGDGRRDTVRIYNAGTKGDLTIWKVKVTTASGKVSSVKFPIPTYQTNKPWYGWAKLDGGKGADLLFQTHSDDGLGLEVLTWRGGKLRREAAPISPSDPTPKAGEWLAMTDWYFPSGYRFYTVTGKRYVNAWEASCDTPGEPTSLCTVKTVKSVWRSG
ncbi:MAG: hypothetical protein KKB93_07845, partial [Actinobacteria bacterium]|nr:hypothetical protein [Actinomycetota bacterium]